ncbi:hypothetical protein BLOT_010180 [Blomia tropicalis]|nr:hypothetical protein BLOT_010180 [Blomia tropicalis]
MNQELKQIKQILSERKQYLKLRLKSIYNEIKKFPNKNTIERIADIELFQRETKEYVEKVTKFSHDSKLRSSFGILDGNYKSKYDFLMSYLKDRSSNFEEVDVDIIVVQPKLSSSMSQGAFKNRLAKLCEMAINDEKCRFIQFLQKLIENFEKFREQRENQETISINQQYMVTIELYLENLICNSDTNISVDELKKLQNQINSAKDLIKNTRIAKKMIKNDDYLQKLAELKSGKVAFQECKTHHNQRFYTYKSFYGHLNNHHPMENNITVKGGEQMAEVFLTTCGSTIREIYREKLSQFVSSLYLQRKYCSLSEFYVGPIERQVCFGSIEKKFYYVPIIKTIKQLLTDELVSIILEETESSCSEYIRNNNLMNKLRLVLYGDDFTVTNPIGNASKNQKIYAAYLDVDNWPLYKTKAHDIPAVFFVHRNTIDKFDSIDKVLEIAVFDLIKLKTNGINVNYRGSEINIQVELAYVVGDNLAGNEMLGLSRTFGVQFICRYCSATYHEIQNDFSVHRELNIHKPMDYDTEINNVEDYHRSKYGFMTRSSLSKLTNNLFQLVPPDTMHDLSEGILPEIIAIVLKEFKLKRNEINQKISKFSWVNGPVFIEKNFEPKGKALQKLEFVIRIIEIYPSWLESSLEIFKWYESIRTIISVSMSTNPMNNIEKLDNVLPNYMNYQKTYGKITPKAHFITHYNELIRFYGSLQPYSTARYERKNGQNKKFIKHSKNFKNTVYSMAHLHQDYAAISSMNDEPSIERKNHSGVPAKFHPFSLKCNILRKVLDEEIYIKPDVFFYLDGNIHVDGKLYEKLPLSKTINNCNGLVTEIQEQPVFEVLQQYQFKIQTYQTNKVQLWEFDNAQFSFYKV